MPRHSRLRWAMGSHRRACFRLSILAWSQPVWNVTDSLRCTCGTTHDGTHSHHVVPSAERSGYKVAAAVTAFCPSPRLGLPVHMSASWNQLGFNRVLSTASLGKQLYLTATCYARKRARQTTWSSECVCRRARMSFPGMFTVGA